jgi:hypothetical protein
MKMTQASQRVEDWQVAAADISDFGDTFWKLLPGVLRRRRGPRSTQSERGADRGRSTIAAGI